MTYEYVCTACGHAWEAEQRISEDPLRDCPSCGASAAKRQITGGQGFILKGGGWYSDLYSSASPKKAEATTPNAGGCGACPAAGSDGAGACSDAKPSGSKPVAAA
ncbi:MAG: zinc ribbon domain-containing protein [Polyangiaceae bacterium]|nr:zinc ribbon domain-containing protein [Polyangiaceae bacterium]